MREVIEAEQTASAQRRGSIVRRVSNDPAAVVKTARVDDLVDLDRAAEEVYRRVPAWVAAGITVQPLTWRDQGDPWPPPLKIDRADVIDADSIGVLLRKGSQEAELVLFKGGWCDLVYWTGDVADDPEQDAPGWPDQMTVEIFGEQLDHLASKLV